MNPIVDPRGRVGSVVLFVSLCWNKRSQMRQQLLANDKLRPSKASHAAPREQKAVARIGSAKANNVNTLNDVFRRPPESCYNFSFQSVVR
jgi:hypothetical protein